MKYSHNNITTILRNINTFKLLKNIHDLQGGREHVQFMPVIEQFCINREYFDAHLKTLIDYGYVKFSRIEPNNEPTNKNLKLTVTENGNVVCGFIMTVLLDFHNSQCD